MPAPVQSSESSTPSPLGSLNFGRKKLLFIAPFVIVVVLVLVLTGNIYFEAGKIGFGKRAAVVNGEVISKGEYDDRLKAQEHFYTNVSKEDVSNLNQKVLEDLIREALLTKVLKDQGLAVTDGEVRERIQKVTVDVNWDGDWAKYEANLKTQYKTSLDEVMRTFRIQLLEEKVKTLTTKKHLHIIWVNKAKVPYSPQEEAAAAIANKPKLENANKILVRVVAGEDFASLARQVSEHKETAEKGGDIGTFDVPGEITNPELYPATEPILKAIEELKEGEAKLYEYWTGYLIAKATDVKDGPVGAKSFDQWYEELRKNADVELLLNQR